MGRGGEERKAEKDGNRRGGWRRVTKKSEKWPKAEEKSIRGKESKEGIEERQRVQG